MTEIRRDIPAAARAAALAVAFCLAAAGFSAAQTQAMDAGTAQALALRQAQGGTAPVLGPVYPVVDGLNTGTVYSTMASSADAGGGSGTPPGAQPAASGAPETPSAIELMFAAMSATLDASAGVAAGAQGGAAPARPAAQPASSAEPLRQFGYSLFSKPVAPSMAAIGSDYILGPGDRMVLYLWGDPVDIKEISASYVLEVDRSGFVFFQPAGQMPAWGQDLGTLRSVIKAALDRRYRKLEMNLTLSRLREFPVNVTGFVGFPGTVLATGLDTVFSVLSRAGGLKKTASLRSVVLGRVGKSGPETRVLDFYDTLISGKPIDLRVREGDSIHMPGIGPVVALAGDVRRPGIYELGPEKTLSSVLSLAGGTLPSARSQSVTTMRFAAGGRVLESGDLADPAFAGRALSDGDFVLFGRVTGLLLGAVELSGAARYPGRYDVRSCPTLKSLLEKAQVLPETGLSYGRVYRIDAAGRDRSFAFAPGSVLAGADRPLAEFDRVVLYRNDGIAADADRERFPETITVSGPVRNPGMYAWESGMKLSRLLSAAAPTLDADLLYAEIVRPSGWGKTQYLTFAPREVLSGKYDADVAGGDMVTLYVLGTAQADVAGMSANIVPADAASQGAATSAPPGATALPVPYSAASPAMYPAGQGFFSEIVRLSGAVRYPGPRARTPTLKLSEVVEGDQLLPDTSLDYAEIARRRPDASMEYLTFAPRDVLSGSFDLQLSARDEITLVKAGYLPPKPDFDRFPHAVSVSGSVRNQGLYSWKPGMKLSWILKAAIPTLDSNGSYAELERVAADGSVRRSTFDPHAVMSGAADMDLEPRDLVRFVPESRVTADASAKAAVAALQAGAGTRPYEAAPDLSAMGGLEHDFDRFPEAVLLTGAVARPDVYAWRPGLALGSILTPAQAVLAMNRSYGEIERRGADGQPQYVSFSPGKVMSGEISVGLEPRDIIRLLPAGYLPEKPDFDRMANAFVVTGPTKAAGLYDSSGNERLSGFVTAVAMQADTDLDYAEIERRNPGGKVEYRTFSPRAVIAGAWDEAIMPRDTVRLIKTGGQPAAHDFGRYPDTVVTQGPVLRPGRFAWRPGLTLADIMGRDELLLETNPDYAEISRRDATEERILSFSPADALSGKAPLALRPRDIVRLYPRYYRKPVTVSGEVAGTKVLAYYEGMVLTEVLRTLEISGDETRMKAVVTRADGTDLTVFLNDLLHRQAYPPVPLLPGDAIAIRKLLPDEKLPLVLVRGAVARPQALQWKAGMRLSDALTGAGGYAADAFPYGLVLIRKTAAEAQSRQVDRLIAQIDTAVSAGSGVGSVADSSLSSTSATIANLQIDLAAQRARLGELRQMAKTGFGRIAVEMPQTLEKLKGSDADVSVEEGDSIFIPTTPTYVIVSGETADQNILAWRKGITVRKALDESGWISRDADLARVYIVRASSRIDSTAGKGFLFFRPSILNYALGPGDMVVVPRKTIRLNATWAYVKDLVQIFSQIVTSAVSTVALIKVL